MNNKFEKFQNIINYKFNDIKLLRQALTHSSFANEKRLDKFANNERLEFLGDAVLELIISDLLFNENKDLLEGDLTKKRASIVCEQTLSLCAKDIQLGEFLSLGKGEDITGGRDRKSILSDAFEAVIGAIYLDGGLANAKEFIYKHILADIENKQLFFDSKTILQEIIQSNYKAPLSYKLLEESGPDHNKIFKVVAMVGNKNFAQGIGSTKKSAEQEAAYNSILMLRNGGK